MNSEVHSAVGRTVEAVNTHQGETCVHLRFEDDGNEIDFMASSARLNGAAFEFSSGFETLSGNVDEVRSIRAEIVCR